MRYYSDVVPPCRFGKSRVHRPDLTLSSPDDNLIISYQLDRPPPIVSNLVFDNTSSRPNIRVPFSLTSRISCAPEMPFRRMRRDLDEDDEEADNELPYRERSAVMRSNVAPKPDKCSDVESMEVNTQSPF
jgi:hypothetical protein